MGSRVGRGVHIALCDGDADREVERGRVSHLAYLTPTGVAVQRSACSINVAAVPGHLGKDQLRGGVPAVRAAESGGLIQLALATA
ncbi:MAG: hypothetical protein JO372_13635 [Solirubrobacterales bacterium]|nr:hypothetical protein [Solirubrobacterales bacterium]